MRIVAALACAVLLLCVGALPGRAEKRVALVIGNSAYQNVARLPNPANDAAAVAALLKGARFDVVEARADLGIAGLRRAVGDFADIAAGADIAVVYYAGHGMEVDGTNYLIPVDARLARDFDIEDEALALDRVLKAIEPARRLRLVILDACRDNPFAKTMKRTVAARSIGRGLARVEPTVADTLIAFAAKAGSTALDGEGANSPFTAALVRHIATPGLDIRLAFGQVRDDVMDATRHAQEPFVYGSLGGRTIAIVDAPATAATPQASEAAQAWAVTQNTKSVAVLEEFIRRYGDSFYAALARARLEELKKSQVAVVAPPAVLGSPCRNGAAVASLTARSAQPLSASEACALKPKDVFKECDKCPEMVVVPAGSFMMGSPSDEKERSADEGPQRRVTFAKQFAAGRFSVTFEEWDACVAGGGCRGYRPSDKGWGRGRRPVINVSWDDAEAYVAWLSRKAGKPYRLLSEAEREYVTRASTTTPFWWGASITTHQANYVGNHIYNGGPKGEYRQRTVLVDTFEPNPWGLYQVHGNVWDWVEDCYHDSYAGAPSEGSAWTVGDCNNRVLRGGSGFDDPRLLRSAARNWSPTVSRGYDSGFRVGRTLTP